MFGSSSKQFRGIKRHKQLERTATKSEQGEEH